MTSLPSANQGMVRGAMVDERVAGKEAATAHAKKGGVKIARDVMAPGPSPVMEAETVAVADAGVVADGAAPGVIVETVPHQAWASASALMWKVNPSHWTRLPQLEWLATSLLARTAHGSNGKTVHHAMLNGGNAAAAARVVGKAGTSVNQTVAHVRMTQYRPGPLPSRLTALPTTHRRTVTQGLRLRELTRAMAGINQAPMSMADRCAKNVRATVMAVTVVRVVTARNAVSAPTARTVHRLTASSRWKVLPLIQEDQMRCQPL